MAQRPQTWPDPTWGSAAKKKSWQVTLEDCHLYSRGGRKGDNTNSGVKRGEGNSLLPPWSGHASEGGSLALPRPERTDVPEPVPAAQTGRPGA